MDMNAFWMNELRATRYLPEVPMEYRNEEICREAVNLNPYNVIYVPSDAPFLGELREQAVAMNPAIAEHLA